VTIRPPTAALRTPRARGGVDLIAVSHPVNVSYLTNFSGDSSWLLAGPKRACSSATGVHDQIQEEWRAQVHIRRTEQRSTSRARRCWAKLGARNVGVEAGHLTLADLETLRETAPSLSGSQEEGRRGLRAIKDAGESPRSAKAVGYAEKRTPCSGRCYAEDTEKGLADAMDGYLRRAGDGVRAFPRSSAWATLRQAGTPAHRAPRRRVAFLLLDWGASGRFYKSDLNAHGLARPHGRSVGASARRDRGNAV